MEAHSSSLTSLKKGLVQSSSISASSQPLVYHRFVSLSSRAFPLCGLHGTSVQKELV
jgi:hypothetical protein